MYFETHAPEQSCSRINLLKQVYQGAIQATFHPKLEKIKKNPISTLKKLSYYLKKKTVCLAFWKWNFQAQRLKNFLFFPKEKSFLCFRGKLSNPEKQKFLDLIFFIRNFYRKTFSIGNIRRNFYVFNNKPRRLFSYNNIFTLIDFNRI